MPFLHLPHTSTEMHFADVISFVRLSCVGGYKPGYYIPASLREYSFIGERRGTRSGKQTSGSPLSQGALIATASLSAAWNHNGP